MSQEIDKPRQVMAIQIILDHQKNQRESLLSAALLAKKLKAKLQGLFIEEENLLRAADLPLSREISLWSGEERHITAESVQRIFRATARQYQKSLEQIALENKIEHSFTVIHAEKDNWIKQNVSAADILFIGGHEVTAKAFKPFKYCSEVTPPLLAIFDGSIASERVLKIALEIAEKNNKRVLILLLSEDSAVDKSLNRLLNELVDESANISFVIERASKNYRFRDLKKQDINMLISPNNIGWVQEEGQLTKFLHQLHCPLVLVN